VTATLTPPHSKNDELVVQAHGPAGGAVGLAIPAVVPEHLLDGGEVVHFAIKPSPWFVLLVSARWLATGAALIVLAAWSPAPISWKWYLWQAGFWLGAARLGWAMLEWVSRLYVLTNRRVMRIRGVFNVELFECALDRIQNTHLTASVGERVMRVGSITVETASAAGLGTWLIVARPLEVHEKLREAIRRAQNRNGNGGL
jgi:hypothetical protein